MADPKPLNRQQLAKICNNDPEAIRLFERLFQVAGQITPDLIVESQFGGDMAGQIDALRADVQGYADLVQRASEIIAANDLHGRDDLSAITQRIADLEVLPPLTPYFPIGASGTFTTVDLKTVTVVNGVITSIV